MKPSVESRRAREQSSLSESFGLFRRLFFFFFFFLNFSSFLEYETRSPGGSEARVISATHFRNIQTRPRCSSPEFCTGCASFSPSLLSLRRAQKAAEERRLRHHVAGLQHRRTICAAVHMKVGRLFPPLRSLVALSLFYSLHYRTLRCIFLQEILHSCSHQLACVGHQ